MLLNFALMKLPQMSKHKHNPLIEMDSSSYIGKSIPRKEIRRLISGQGTYVDDIQGSKIAHVVFVRSPYAHAKILNIAFELAKTYPGVIEIVKESDISQYCQPYQGLLKHLEGMKAVFQTPLAVDKVYWHGHPVIAVVAETRAQAEDAAELVTIDWEELPPVVNEEEALLKDSPLIHPELGSNLCWERKIDCEGIEEIFNSAHTVVEENFTTSRHTHVTLEPRSILADYRSSDNQLIITHSTQVPHMMHWVVSHLFSIPESQVRIIAPDVGGSFGLKIHVYGDEMTAIALAIKLKRPIKFIADRLESFLSDYHSRDHRVWARMAFSEDGKIQAIEMDDLQSMGAFTGYPRGSVNEARQIINLVGGAYDVPHYKARTRVAYQNKSMYGQYRSVGHPVACLVTEGLMDRGAQSLGIDPAKLRQINYIPQNSFPKKLKSGPTIENLSQHEALDRLLEMMGYLDLRSEQKALREKGIYRGIGFASFLEMSNPSSNTYGRGGVSIAAQDASTVRLMPDGTLFCTASINEFGQGAATIAAQIVADVLGVSFDRVRVSLGDTDIAPFGGDNWGSRGTGIGGEAIYQTALALKNNILDIASQLFTLDIAKLGISKSYVIKLGVGTQIISLEDLARIVYFQPEKYPSKKAPELSVTRSYAQKTYDGICTNGIQASYLEVDPEIGEIKLLKHWVVEDCGVAINPLLIDEQIRGGVIQGIGAALYEHCIYNEDGQLTNGNFMDYLVPMAFEMPDIEIAHTCTPTKTSNLGAKGAGEAGVAGASAAVLNAVNDALSVFNVHLNAIPITPQNIIRKLYKFYKE
jgi:carbon-monoxide dehydrogenase large subunit